MESAPERWGWLWRGPGVPLEVAAADGEHLIARLRVTVVLCLLCILVLAVLDLGLRPGVWVSLACQLVALAHAGWILAVTRRRAGRAWIGFASAAGDATLVSLSLAGFVLAGYPSLATNHPTIFPVYFLVIASTALRYDTRVCVATVLASLAPLHDIGKVGVPDRVLNKPGHLTPEELAEMRRHPRYGRDVIENAERAAGVKDDVALSIAKDIVYTHHEWWDGSGYPEGLSGTAIPIPGRVMAVVDVYDAIITRRLYQTPMSNDEAIAHIVQSRGTHFDPAVVDAFVNVAPRLHLLSQEPEG